MQEIFFFCAYFWKVLSQQTKNVKINIRNFWFSGFASSVLKYKKVFNLVTRKFHFPQCIKKLFWWKYKKNSIWKARSGKSTTLLHYTLLQMGLQKNNCKGWDKGEQKVKETFMELTLLFGELIEQNKSNMTRRVLADKNKI